MKTDSRALEQARTRPANCCNSPIVAQLKALGHPVRMQIVRQLAERDRCCCGDFCACMPLAQSTISQHLDVLCKAGLVRLEPKGTRSLYSLERNALSALADAVEVLSGDDGMARSANRQMQEGRR